MPHYVCMDVRDGKRYYFMWSTIVDAPITPYLPLVDFLRCYRDMYGVSGLRVVADKIERADRQGTSCSDGRPLSDLASGNKAGPDGSELTLDEIAAKYLAEPD